MYGWRGKLLDITLAGKGKIEEIPLDIELAKQYLGGAGLGVRMLSEMIDADTDPLGGDNPLIFITGPFCGTMVPTSGKATVVARSPQTGLLGYSTFGGHLGADIKFAGYDGIIIRETAPTPKYISINDDDVSIVQADHIWGKDTEETWNILKEESGHKNPGVARIGIAGENLVKYASIIIDHHRAAGRTGMGAVMGSKKLKAIVVHGSDRKIPVLKPEEISAKAQELNADRKEDATFRMYSDLGTAGFVDMASMMYGSLPAGYYTVSDFDSYKISGTSVKETILVGKKSCFRCPIGCGRVIEIKEGKYATERFAGPELEITGTMGTLILNNDVESLAHASKQFDLMGVDYISGGNTIAFAYYLFKEGIITSEDLDGVSPEWGEIDSAMTLLHKISRREGIGDLMAEGSKAFGEKFGVGELSVEVNGMETPMHDPRGFSGHAIGYATSPRGACHMSADMYNWQMGVVDEGFEIESIDRFENEAELTARVQNFRCITNSVLVCNFYPIYSGEIAELLTMVTGVEYSLDDVAKAGERIFTLMRLLNLKLGYDTAGEILPKLLSQPLEGATEGHVPNIEEQLQKWYEFRGWDRTSGKPPSEKLTELGLDGVV